MPIAFDPNAAAAPDSGIFGLPFAVEESRLVLIPVPWEATLSGGEGTAGGPEAILAASRQVDYCDVEMRRPWAAGIAMLPPLAGVADWNRVAREAARRVIARGEAGDAPGLQADLAQVNALGERVRARVFEATAAELDAGRMVGIVGGEHSVPLGAIEAVAARHAGLGILHVDAHLDLRAAYEGFVLSHASIMRNVVERVPGVARLVSVGPRDFCEEELDYAQSGPERIRAFFDGPLRERLLRGETFHALAEEIVAALPGEVWISFDIDGLDPALCPETGTPVPGGLSFPEADHLLRLLVRSGRRILGFDLCEVAAAPRDANVGARLLYRLCAWTLAAQGGRPNAGV